MSRRRHFGGGQSDEGEKEGPRRESCAVSAVYLGASDVMTRRPNLGRRVSALARKRMAERQNSIPNSIPVDKQLPPRSGRNRRSPFIKNSPSAGQPFKSFRRSS